MAFRSIKRRLEKKAQFYSELQSKNTKLSQGVGQFLMQEFGQAGTTLCQRVMYDPLKKHVILEPKNKVYASELHSRLERMRLFLSQLGIEVTQVILRI
ncbi:MAG: hypothetical protein Q8P35_00100 [Candidatus Yanofskybacteria bacterium]|nr:hypothetical protein [Candidatus Yanofskybacteria bacterium]